jgi:hypothetical protein
MKQAHEELERRRVAWSALSELYLDSDVAQTLPDRVDRLASTGYTVNELQQILAEEVHPVCWKNLLSPAGVWTAFDQTWLEERILRHLARPRWFRSLLSWRCRMLHDPEWQQTVQALVERGVQPA